MRYNDIVTVRLDPPIGICSRDTTLMSSPTSPPVYYYPQPWDSTITVGFDVTGDGIDDFEIKSAHDEILVSPHAHYWFWYISITGKHDSAYVAIANNTNNPLDSLYLGDTINYKLDWDNLGHFYLDMYGSVNTIDCVGERYIGLKIGQTEPKYGWMHVSKDSSGYCCNFCDQKFWIMSHAMNMGAKRFITAGQEE